MAEGTTLHNLLAKQMTEGKIGPKEAGTRMAINFTTAADIKANAKSRGAMNDYVKKSVDQSSKSIKTAREIDNIAKSLRKK